MVRGRLLRGGFCPWGRVSAPGGEGGGGIPACTEADPPVNRMTNRCKNITLATTSLRPVIRMALIITDFPKVNKKGHMTFIMAVYENSVQKLWILSHLSELSDAPVTLTDTRCNLLTDLVVLHNNLINPLATDMDVTHGINCYNRIYVITSSDPDVIRSWIHPVQRLPSVTGTGTIDTINCACHFRIVSFSHRRENQGVNTHFGGSLNLTSHGLNLTEKNFTPVLGGMILMMLNITYPGTWMKMLSRHAGRQEISSCCTNGESGESVPCRWLSM